MPAVPLAPVARGGGSFEASRAACPIVRLSDPLPQLEAGGPAPRTQGRNAGGGGGGGGGAGGEGGGAGRGPPPPPQAGASSTSTERPTIAERDDPERRLDTEPPPITFPTTPGVISAGEEASSVPKGPQA